MKKLFLILVFLLVIGTVSAVECNDLIDNDGDGDFDLADSGCSSASDDSEGSENSLIGGMCQIVGVNAKGVMGSGGVVASCPSGTTVVGGGWSLFGPNTDTSKPLGNGWYCDYNSFDKSACYAVCCDDSSIETVVVEEVGMFSNGVTASCPSSYEVLSGGFYDVLQESLIDKGDQDSIRPVGNGWYCYDDESSASGSSCYAVCGKAKKSGESLSCSTEVVAGVTTKYSGINYYKSKSVVNCPSGTFVTGGGFTDNSVDNDDQDYSNPLINGWGCYENFESDSGVPSLCYARCCEVESSVGECDDGIDNDGDGVIDFPDDPGCYSLTDPSERSTRACDDGKDNDNDGTIDYPEDPGCTGPGDLSEKGVTQCDNGVDDDGDKSIDYPHDSGCTGPGDNTEKDFVPVTACNDGADNDGDGFVDLADPGCSSSLDTSELNFGVACDNGIDDDHDGFIDMADPGCSSPTDNNEVDPAPVTACNDGIDNDGDGQIDLVDPGCSSSLDTSELNSAIECDDGLDNDGDGKIDLIDPDCANSLDDDESPVLACADGIDNDGDGLIDLADPGCVDSNDASELNPGIACDDGSDNDGDGLIDMLDPGCTSPLDTSEFGVISDPSNFKPLVWLDDNSRKVYKSAMNGGGLSDRSHNYAFEGEQIAWDVLVMDKNGVPEKIKDVYVALGKVGESNKIEANCKLKNVLTKGHNIRRFNAKIGQEKINKVNANGVFAIYECLLTVETQSSMQGEYWVTIEAEDLGGLIGSLTRTEYWFFNPFVSVKILGDLDFGALMPGHTLYSDTILVENNAEDGSGVELNMYISGTDFYDGSHSGAKCPVSNKLDLSNFRYYATNGAYSSTSNPGSDIEGYDSIVYGNKISSSETILGGIPYKAGFIEGNVLNEGNEMSLSFKLDVPEPCNGNFNNGDISFWFDII